MQENPTAHVLVIDDEYAICSSISELLECHGFTAGYSMTAAEGMGYLRKNPQTDIVLLDIDLGPGPRGHELLPKIKEQCRYAQVIMFTSQSDLDMGVECLKRGAMDYLTKPFQERKFFKKVPIALEKKKLLQLNDLYMGILVHDLNNPIQYIQGALDYLQLSLRPSLTEQQHDLFKTAEKGLSQIKTMIGNILTISKFENGLFSLNIETFSLSEEVASVLKIFENEINRSGRKMIVTYSRRDSMTTDKELFSRIIMNVVGNAVRYTPHGGTITVAVENDGDDILNVAVSNTGSFIEEEKREIIFDKFASVHLERKPAAVQNFGLGLTFCKMAIKTLGGSIWVDGNSEIPETTFHFSLKNQKECTHGV